ncbi:hypothetical protein CBL_06951 [Carabus blaptoides fortunei]
MNSLITVWLIYILLVIQANGNYRLFLEKVLVPYCDEEYTFSNATTFKYNRTHIALNQTWIIYKKFPPDLKRRFCAASTKMSCFAGKLSNY